MLADVWKRDIKDLIVVSPDVGGVMRARALAKRLEYDLATLGAGIGGRDRHHEHHTRHRPHDLGQ